MAHRAMSAEVPTLPRETVAEEAVGATLCAEAATPEEVEHSRVAQAMRHQVTPVLSALAAEAQVPEAKVGSRDCQVAPVEMAL